MSPTPLTLDTVNEYLTQKLGLTNWKDQLNQDELGFLKSFVRKHVCNVPFHNISLSATEPEDRRGPTLEEIITNGLSANGGLCINQNYFVKLVLEALGFRVFAIGASWTCSLKPGTHVILAVWLPNPRLFEEAYIVDVGCGQPIWEPVPLHQLPFSRVMGGYGFEFRATPEGIFQRVQLKGNFFKGDFEDVTEKVQYTFELQDKAFDEFEVAMNWVMSSPLSPLPKLPFLFRHIEAEESPDGVMVWGKTVVRLTSEGYETEVCQTYEEAKERILQFFPNLSRTQVEKAIDFCTKFEVIPYRYS